MAEADPRYALRHSHDWVADLMTGITPEVAAAPTPCAGWDVSRVASHHVAGARRLRAMGLGEMPPADSDVQAPADPQEWAVAYHDAVEALWKVWDDDELLERTYQAPWGEVTGAQLLAGMTMEVVVHGWDLAVATGQPGEAPADAATAALESARASVPPGREGRPFDEPVQSAPDAGITEQLANWLGRTRP